jgi:hypothetical protein
VSVCAYELCGKPLPALGHRPELVYCPNNNLCKMGAYRLRLRKAREQEAAREVGPGQTLEELAKREPLATHLAEYGITLEMLEAILAESRAAGVIDRLPSGRWVRRIPDFDWLALHLGSEREPAEAPEEAA